MTEQRGGDNDTCAQGADEFGPTRGRPLDDANDTPPAPAPPAGEGPPPKADAIVYTRVDPTDDDAADKESGVRQEARCRDFAARLGITVGVSYGETTTGDDWTSRPMLAAVLDAIGRGDVTQLIVEDPSRLSPIPSHRLELLGIAERHGVDIVTVSGEFIDDAEGDADDGPFVPTGAQRELLHQASVVLIDLLFADLQSIDDPDWNLRDSMIGSYLPAKYLPRYSPRLLKRFFVCVVTVAGKLADFEALQLTCLAEVLAMNAILEQAKVLAEMAENAVAFEDIEEEVFEDVDFKFLFDPRRDGIEETVTGHLWGMESLALKDWFTPYGGGDRGPVHPYVEDVDFSTSV